MIKTIYARIVAWLYLFSIPFGVKYVLFSPISHYFGAYSSYTSYVLTLEMFFAVCLCLLVRPIITKEVIFLLLLALLPVFWSVEPVLHVWYVFHGAIFFLASFSAFSLYPSLFPFVIGVLISLLIGVLQVYLQQSIGLHWLGESVFTVETYNIAKTWIGNMLYVRPMGFFEHANIFGAYTFFLAVLLERRHSILARLVLCLSLFSLSRSLLLPLMFWFFAKKIRFHWFDVFIGVFVFVLCIYRMPSIVVDIGTRLDYFTWYPFSFLGAGAVQHMLSASDILPAYQAQPIHSAIFVLLYDYGILFVIALFVLNLRQKYTGYFLLLILFTAFDHWYVTSIDGFAFISLVYWYAKNTIDTSVDAAV